MSHRPFRFRLERVRDLRERHEDLAKQAVAGALARRQAEETALRSAERRVEQARAAQRTGGGVCRSAAELLALQAYLERTELARRASAGELERRESELSSSREALAAAAREREILERLKSRRRAEHDQESDRLEGTRLDEIAINAYNRRAA